MAPTYREVDLLVLGAGAAGLAAGLAGALLGLKVEICEASGLVGGTASTSAGTLWIPANTQSRRVGLNDSVVEARKYLGQLIPDHDAPELVEAFLAQGPRLIDFLEAHSQVRFGACGRHPDYLDLPGASVAGRAIAPLPFDGRLLGREFGRIRPPMAEFMVLGGMMLNKVDIANLLNRYRSVSSFAHAAQLLVRHARDRLTHERGTRLVMGNALVARLYHSVLRSGASVTFDAPLTELLMEDGRVAGALIEDGGEPVRIRAACGVVLATGGFAHNAELRARLMPDAKAIRSSLACPTNQGAGILNGQRVGALIEPEKHGTGAFWAPSSVTIRAGGQQGLFPHLLLDRAKPGIIAVNALGRRFVNEGASYHHFVEAIFKQIEAIACAPSYLVCTAKFIRKYGLGAIHPGTTRLGKHVDSGYLVMDVTISGLAVKLGIDPEALSDSVERNNRYAQTGVDLDFRKGSVELNRFNGDSEHGPNPCLGAIEDGPFCAMAIWPTDLGCSTGLATNIHAQVLSADGTVIDGLYACGNDMASIFRGTYPGPGTTLGPGIVFGCLAAEHAKARRDASSDTRHLTSREATP